MPCIKWPMFHLKRCLSNCYTSHIPNTIKGGIAHYIHTISLSCFTSLKAKGRSFCRHTKSLLKKTILSLLIGSRCIRKSRMTKNHWNILPYELQASRLLYLMKKNLSSVCTHIKASVKRFYFIYTHCYAKSNRGLTITTSFVRTLLKFSSLNFNVLNSSRLN